jgi:hypothetical protein
MHGAARRGCNPCLSTGAARALLAALLAGPAPRATVPTRYLARLEHSEQGPFGVLTGAWRGLAGVQWGVSGWEACERVIQQGGGGEPAHALQRASVPPLGRTVSKLQNFTRAKRQE